MPRLGFKHSEESKRKMSASLKGCIPWNKGRTGVYSEETLKNWSIVRKGIKLSEATKRKMSVNNGRYWLGRKLTEEHKQKLSDVHKGVKLSEEHKRKIAAAGIGRICSEETRKKLSASATGRKLSEETKKKLRGPRLGSRGRKLSEETKRKISESHKGIRPSEEARKKMSDAKKGRTGEKAANWQGGISFEPYTPEFNDALKEKVRKRDNHICQLCGKTEEQEGKRLSVHHIDYQKENCAEDNLMSLCHSCNAKVNFDRLDWMHYFQKLQEIELEEVLP